MPISWEDALDETAQRLHQIQQEHGKNAVSLYLGNPTAHNHGALFTLLPFTRALNTRQRYSATSADQLPHQLATYKLFGHQALFPIPDIDRTDYFMVIGGNPVASNGSIMTVPDVKNRIKALQKRGGKMVVIDPRRTETAKVADEHHFVRPGTDVYLLLRWCRCYTWNRWWRRGGLIVCSTARKRWKNWSRPGHRRKPQRRWGCLLLPFANSPVTLPVPPARRCIPAWASLPAPMVRSAPGWST